MEKGEAVLELDSLNKNNDCGFLLEAHDL